MKRLTREEKRAQTRAALLDAAAAVFVRRGLAGASVEEISAEAGYTRGAFYSNFKSKNELFVELLQERVYAGYRALTQRRLEDPERMPTLRETGEELAALQADPDGHWLFRLWLELLAHSARDEELRALASTFWSGNRALVAEVTRLAYERAGEEPPADPKTIASTLIALDIGLALQHFVDPGDVPLSVYPDAYALLAGTAPGSGGARPATGSAQGARAKARGRGDKGKRESRRRQR